MAKIPHVARNLQGNRSYINDYPGPADPVAAPIAVGDFVRLTADVIERVTGLDPTNILGIAKSHNGGAAREEAIDPTRILVEHLDDNNPLWMEGTRAPLATDKGKSYGFLTDPAGGTHYALDLAETVNTRAYVVDVDLTRNAYFVIVLAAHRQSLVAA